MRYLDLKLGYHCNNNCVHCIIVDQRRGALEKRGNETRTYSEIVEKLNIAKNEGYNTVVFTGGEPTIRKDFISLLEYASKIGMSISVQSNGRRFSDAEFAKIASKYIDNVIIALHGDKEELHDKITQVRGSFKETVEGIKNLGRYNIKVSIKMVLSKINYQHMLGTVKLAEKLKCLYINIAFPHANENMLKQYNQLVPTYSEISQYVIDVVEYVKEFSNIRCEFETLLSCTLNQDIPLEYFADFKMYKVDTKLLQLDSDEIKWSEVRKTIKKKMSNCSSCIYNEFCEGTWMEYVKLKGETEFIPIIEYKGKNNDGKK